MAPPLYFFPKVSRAQLAPEGKLARSMLAARGLDRTLADVADVQAECSVFELPGAGPGANSGCLLIALPVSGEAPPRLGYFPEFQTWVDYGSLWVGVDREYPPTPVDLARKRQHAGYLLDLAGRQWSVPVIRDPVDGTGLPRDWEVRSDGGVNERIEAAYATLWEEFSGVVDLFFSADHPSPAGALTMDRAEALRRCLDVLAINYRVGTHEQNALHLVGSETWTSVLSAAVDLPTFHAVFDEAQAKKKRRRAAASESTDTSAGLPAEVPATDPASPS